MRRIFRFLKFLLILLVISSMIIAYHYRDDLKVYVLSNLIYHKEVVLKEADSYQKQDTFSYIEETDQFLPENREELLQVFYTIFNRGWDKFTFFCNYSSCIDDVFEIANDDALLSSLNNYVHPYHSFDEIFVSTNFFGQVTIEVTKLYSDRQIREIEAKVDQVMEQIITPDMTVREKIKAIHDYIINTTTYDTEKAKLIEQGIYNKKSTYQSHIAYGPLLEGHAICGGYSDAMAIFLDRLGLPNYKIASQDHVWNYVKLEDGWYHLDLTWDDPVLKDGKPLLIYTFFLIDTKTLEEKATTQHQYQKEYYLEAS